MKLIFTFLADILGRFAILFVFLFFKCSLIQYRNEIIYQAREILFIQRFIKNKYNIPDDKSKIFEEISEKMVLKVIPE